jgi:hypothetical protein
VSEVFQQTLSIGGTCEETEEQEVVPNGATRDRALRRSVPLLLLPLRRCLSVPPTPKKVAGEFENTATIQSVGSDNFGEYPEKRACAPDCSSLLNYAAEVWRVVMGLRRTA